MDKEAYKQLLVSLKKCELNYHAHVREFGKLGKPEIKFLGRNNYLIIMLKVLKKLLLDILILAHFFQLLKIYEMVQLTIQKGKEVMIGNS